MSHSFGIITAFSMALMLAGCQSSTPVSESNKSRIAAAGFSALQPPSSPSISVDGMYLCREPQCKPRVALLLATKQMTPPAGLNTTIEEALRKSGEKGLDFRAMLQIAENVRNGGRLTYERATLNRTNGSVSVLTRATMPDGRTVFASGALRISGNSLIGGMAMSESKANAIRYGALAARH